MTKNTKAARILIADDDDMIIKLLDKDLTEMGYKVAGQAFTGEDAVTMAKNLNPDLALVDIVMGGKIDGIAAARKISLDYGIPVIFITAYESDRMINKAKKTVPYGYILKPFTRKEVKAAIEIALYKRKMDEKQRIRADSERSDLIRQVESTEKLATFGRLAGAVAHEINNPLTSLLTTAEMLIEELDEDSRHRCDVEEIIEQSNRIKNTVKGFLGFARTRDFKLENEDINGVLDGALKVIGRAKMMGIRLIKECDNSIGKIKISRYHIEETFINIILNAVSSMNGKGVLTVSTCKNQDEVIVVFKDTGQGILKKDLKQIFKPFFTTKGRFRGTGIGLTAAAVIMNSHGGRIEAISEGKGKGAEFKLIFPELK
ncbi:MAG: response regulator [Elusimicrobiota bacterium]